MILATLKLVWKQNRLVYLFLTILAVGYIFVIFAIAPDDVGISSFLGLLSTPYMQGFFGVNVQQLAAFHEMMFLIFFGFILISVIANIFPGFAVWFGGLAMSEEVEGGLLDITSVTPHTRRDLVLRPLIIHVSLLTLSLLVTYLSVLLFFNLYGRNTNYITMFNVFVLVWVSTISFFLITFSMTIITLRSDFGRSIGAIIFVLSFFFSYSANFSSEAKYLENLSLFSYTNPIELLFENYGQETLIFDNFIPLIIACGCCIVSIFIFIRRDLLPLELSIHFNHKIPKNGVSIVNNDIVSNTTSKNKFVGRFTPECVEQWILDKRMLVIFVVLYILIGFTVFLGFPRDIVDIAAYAAVYSRNPLIVALLHGYSFSDLSNDSIVLLYPQFYGYTWIYYLPFIILATFRIIGRDFSGNTLDILQGQPVSIKHLIFSRLMVVFVELIIISIVNAGMIIGMQFVLNKQMAILEQIIVFVLIPVTYGSFLCVLLAFAMVFPFPDSRKKLIIGITTIAILFIMLPYMDASLLNWRIFSFFHYFDPVGMIHYGIKLPYILPFSVIIILFVISLGVIYYYSDKMVLI